MSSTVGKEPEGLATDSEVSGWWSGRWVLFNGLLLAIGVASIFAMEFLMGAVLPEGEDAVEPFALVFGVLAFAVGANLVFWNAQRGELKARDVDPVAARAEAVRAYGNILRVGALLASIPLWWGLLFWLGHATRGK